MNAGINYKLFYEILLHLREDYHSLGRIDDSNAKLDEIVKLIILSYHFALKKQRFSLAFVKQTALEKYGDSELVALALRDLFNSAISDPFFHNSDGTSIFGGNPSLNIQPSENLFACRLISEIEKIDFLYLSESDSPADFDLINECFGHFVRENFRNNKEDAQYMTPSEIATPILDMIFHDFIRENYLDNYILQDFKIMDPTCGVGTLIIEASRHYIKYIMSTDKIHKEESIKDFLSSGVIAQDKVDRMVRLSKINTLLMGGNIQNINAGNSIYDTTFIDDFAESIDLIFTNPPFGANYTISELNLDDYCGLKELSFPNSTISSELLMLLKCLKLLKANGKLAIVLPDSFFSAKGIHAQVRHYVISNYTINAVIEMPAVTFAQAGTRTKTSILYLTKKAPEINESIVMGICNDIGFNVKERMGVPVKIKTNLNEMELIASVYCKNNHHSIMSITPSVTNIHVDELIHEVLHPSFYSVDRLQTVEMLQQMQTKGYELKKLSEIVSFNTIGATKIPVASTAGIAVGQSLVVTNNTTSESNFVEAIDGDVITLRHPLNIACVTGDTVTCGDVTTTLTADAPLAVREVVTATPLLSAPAAIAVKSSDELGQILTVERQVDDFTVIVEESISPTVLENYGTIYLFGPRRRYSLFCCWYGRSVFGGKIGVRPPCTDCILSCNAKQRLVYRYYGNGGRW